SRRQARPRTRGADRLPSTVARPAVRDVSGGVQLGLVWRRGFTIGETEFSVLVIATGGRTGGYQAMMFGATSKGEQMLIVGDRESRESTVSTESRELLRVSRD